MKILLIGLMLSSTAFAGSYLKMSECTGPSPEGDELSFALYVEEDFYCEEKENYKGLVVEGMGALDALVGATAEGAVNVSVTIQDEVRGSLNVLELNFQEFGYPHVQKAQVRMLTEEMTYQESEVTCQNIEYHMDC